MGNTEYDQNLVDMQHHITELNRFLFQTKVRKTESDAFPEKLEIYPHLKMLTALNHMYNIDEEKYSFT
ncbi:MAG: hypothetical protein KAI18_00495, partial [Candidatus Aenigmarchaeota archaeon]|nr:hypothetical protein [Candidatus Aenigmarchaeota archaeon]